MSDAPLDPKLLERAVYDRRFTALVRAGIDLGQLSTWDANLDRRTRIMVPVDVQAMVVPASGGEATVPVTGGAGDPAPFSAGAVRPAGVHLHWALPDALLSGRHDGQSPTAPSFPRLPDRWVVIRALMPVGKQHALLKGWVLDARTGSTTPLSTYAGTPAAAPPDTPVIEPLDATRGGSAAWTASYTAAAGRFAFHDPLGDLPAAGSTDAPQGLSGNQGVYVVAGWWSDAEQDPLAGSHGASRLDDRLAQLGWLAHHDGDDEVQQAPDPRLARDQSNMGLKSPAPMPKVEAMTPDGVKVGAFDAMQIGASVPVAHAEKVVLAPARPSHATLLHGAVLGVPVAGALPAGADDRPSAAGVRASIGFDVDDVVAAFSAGVLGAGAENRLAAERLVAAFTGDLLDRLGTADGIGDVEEREHADRFNSLVGTPVPGARPDRLRGEDSAPMGPTTVGRKGRAAAPKDSEPSAGLKWKHEVDMLGASVARKGASRTFDETTARPSTKATGSRSDVRQVTRPAPRWYQPQPPMLALRGAHPSHRHHGDGLFDADGKLRCRYPQECAQGWDGVISGATVVPSLASGAVPDEVVLAVREAVVLNPYATQWLAEAGSAAPDSVPVFSTRLTGEMVRLYGADGRYDGVTRWTTASAGAVSAVSAGDAWSRESATQRLADRQVTSALADFSLLAGTPPSPVGFTTWRQPWVPLWLEWRVTLQGSDSAEGWTLDGVELKPPQPEPAPSKSFTFSGRSMLDQGVNKAIAGAIARRLQVEAQLDATSPSHLPADEQAALGRLGDFLRPLDLVSTSMAGIREQLLGIPYVGCAEHAPPDGSGESKPLASGLPVPLFGGTLRVDALRLVDAFGRTLDVPAAGMVTTSELEVAGAPGRVRLAPRFQHQARWLFRLVDPALPPSADPTTARDAFVDQLDPTLAVNPVAGFLLPDHIDEALEVFSAAGTPLGQLAHDPISGAVTWEVAPGRPLPPDAGPLDGLEAHDRFAGELAAGLVRADVSGRAADAPPDASALSALLRAVDTTLWTVDTFASLGSDSVAGLVGRPVAVVRATLRLEAPDDVDEVSVTAPGGEGARRDAFRAVVDRRFPIKLGTLTRSDDALLGFFVDDDYEHLRLVDKVVASSAMESGRHRGQLGLLGAGAPPVDPLSHPYVIDDGTVYVRPGQTLRLTLLMLPAGKVHLTSGVLPVKALSLANEWVGPGLRKLMPSIRVGPLLVDPSEIRLPLPALLGDKQTFTRRTGPLTWKDDPILAATQTALLPRMPHEAQEGWIRVTPEEPEGGT